MTRRDDQADFLCLSSKVDERDWVYNNCISFLVPYEVAALPGRNTSQSVHVRTPILMQYPLIGDANSHETKCKKLELGMAAANP